MKMNIKVLVVVVLVVAAIFLLYAGTKSTLYISDITVGGEKK
jgi:hypothetical protein